MKEIKVLAPATIANLVCGFDILGMALKEPYDEMTLAFKDEPGITIVHTDEFELPEEPEQNVSGVALQSLMEEYNKPVGFNLTIHKNIKPGSGLGSSAASSAGAVVAANHLLGYIFSKEDLVRFAMNGEKIAGGVKHADNVSPCIYGGVTLIRSIFPLDIIPLNVPPLFITIVHPQIEVRTSDSRQILRKTVQLKDAIRQWGNIGGLVMGFMNNDFELIGRSLEDVIIEPIRSILIPGFDEIKESCREAGSLGGGISGSGPSIFMVNKTEETALKVEKIMSGIYERIGVDYKTYVTSINTTGVKIVE
ncbi:homoserine kinase [Hanamia caeni]|uniref:Homoserine kinase n=1 Tax=Hanamia caeni TaxID=2294116 RepID=A0A3M9NEL0_9BACT|nr:homoserine kinase [Hanamia caeni]RNI35653.1 homoserine kinase [Hanamia caeni]